jgi:hypothetical protein
MGSDDDTISLFGAADSSIGLARGSIRSLRVGSTSTATPGTAATGVRNDAHRRIRPDDLKKIGAVLLSKFKQRHFTAHARFS